MFKGAESTKKAAKVRVGGVLPLLPRLTNCQRLSGGDIVEELRADLAKLAKSFCGERKIAFAIYLM